MRLTDRFIKDHKAMASVVKVFEKEIDEIELGNSDDFRVIDLALEFIIDYPDVIHHPNEEVMFSRLDRLDSELDGSLRILRDQHKIMAKDSKSLKKRIKDLHKGGAKKRKQFTQAAQEFIAQQFDHMRLEESDVFPKAQSLLNAADWSAIGHTIYSLEGEDSDDRLEIAFDELRRIILKMSKA